MNTITDVPPGFRFHPTDEELVDYYLRNKLTASKFHFDIIKHVDLYRIEPWDLQELCKLGSEEENEWYFFSHKDKKYPTGSRTNRATKAGFWKATGRDKAIYSKHCLIGMRKTLVFYKGRAPNGHKSDWIMHEYRLQSNENAIPQEEGWVVCRVFKKKMTTVKRMDDSPYLYNNHVSFMTHNPNHHYIPNHNNLYHHNHRYPCKQELEIIPYNNSQNDPFLKLPQLKSPKIPQTSASDSSVQNYEATNVSIPSLILNQNQIIRPIMYESEQIVDDQVIDWRDLDKFVALSEDECARTRNNDLNYSNASKFPNSENTSPNSSKQDLGVLSEYDASTSTSSCQIDLWK